MRYIIIPCHMFLYSREMLKGWQRCFISNGDTSPGSHPGSGLKLLKVNALLCIVSIASV